MEMGVDVRRPGVRRRRDLHSRLLPPPVLDRSGRRGNPRRRLSSASRPVAALRRDVAALPTSSFRGSSPNRAGRRSRRSAQIDRVGLGGIVLQDVDPGPGRRHGEGRVRGVAGHNRRRVDDPRRHPHPGGPDARRSHGRRVNRLKFREKGDTQHGCSHRSAVRRLGGSHRGRRHRLPDRAPVRKGAHRDLGRTTRRSTPA